MRRRWGVGVGDVSGGVHQDECLETAVCGGLDIGVSMKVRRHIMMMISFFGFFKNTPQSYVVFLSAPY